MDEEFIISLAIGALLSIIAVPIVVLIKVITLGRRQRELAGAVESLEDTLKRELRKLASAQKPAVAAEPASAPTAPRPAPVAVPLPAQPMPAAAPLSVPRPPPPPPPPAPRVEPAPVRAAPHAPAPALEPSPFEQAVRTILTKTWNWIVVGEEHRPQGVSMEYAVATNWLLRLGVLILVCGVGFFLRYSYVNGLIGPVGRVSISLVGAVAMLATGIRLLGRRYHLLGQGLLGAGLATMYFSAFAAFSFYHLVEQLPCFAMMALITVAAGVMAVRFNSLLIAVLGLAGGYGTPIMLSTGQVQFVGLFSYMLLLGVGILGISHRRNWLLLKVLSFVATYGLFFAALDGHYAGTPDFWRVMPFLAAFFVLFSTMIFIHNVACRVPSTMIELVMLLANAGIFYAEGHSLIAGSYPRHWVSALTLGLGAFYAVHVNVFIARRLQDKPLITAFIGLASLFLVITIPLLLSREWITVSWACQALVLLWMAGRLDSEFLRQVAYLLYAMVFGRLFILDLPHQFAVPAAGEALPLGRYAQDLLERVVMFGVPIASVAGAHRLLRRAGAAPGRAAIGAANNVRAWVNDNAALRVSTLCFALGLFVYLHLELNRTFGLLYPPIRLPVLTWLWLGAAWVVLAGCAGGAGGVWRRGLLLALFAAVLVKLAVVDLVFWSFDPGRMVCAGDYRGLDALMRLLDFGSVAALLAYGFTLMRRDAGTEEEDARLSSVMGYAGLALLFAYATLEMNTFLHAYVAGLRAGGVSVLWSLFALAFVLAGTLRGVRPLRLVGLALFAVTAGKVFVSDLAHLEPVYRIVAFIALGLLLLTGSFVYLKFRTRFQTPVEEAP